MIRAVSRVIALLLMIAVSIGVARLAHSMWSDFGALRSEDGIRLEQTNLSLVYDVPRFGWLEFPAPSAERVVRMVAHADVPTEVLGQPDRIFSFLVRVRFVSARGVVLDERNTRFRTRGVQYRDLDTGEIFRRAFYPGGGPQPTSAQETRMNLPDADVHSIRFQLIEADPDVRAVQLRVYKREPPAAHRLDTAWDRLSARTRSMLASGNLYPVEFLSEREKVNLVRNRWKPAGPRGIEGEDYVVSEMRVFRSRNGELLGQEAAHVGEYVADWLNLPVTIPEAGRLRIEFDAVRSDDGVDGESPLPLQVAATWYANSVQDANAFMLPVSETGIATIDVEPGLLDLQFSAAGYVRAYLQTASRLEQELDIRRLGVRHYSLDPENLVTFPVRHAGDEGTTLRIDLSSLGDRIDPPGRDAVPAARYRLRDAGGMILQDGELRKSRVHSRYAYARMQVPMPLSEPARYMIHLPEQATSLELLGTDQFVASVFSRPRDLPRRVRVSGFEGADGAGAIRRLWFPLRPRDYEALRNSARSMMVMRGTEPPEPDLERQLTGTRWERFEPEGDWVGRYLIDPRNPEAEFQQRSLPVVFRRIEPNTDHELEIEGTGIETAVPLRLVVRRASARAVPVRVWVDGRLRWRGRLSGRISEMAVGQVRTGKHRVRVEIPGSAEVLVNFTGPGDAGYTKRLVIRVRKPELVIPVEKRGAEKELLSGVVYFPSAAGETLDMRAEILGEAVAGLQPFASSTVTVSEFEFEGGDGPEAWVLNARDAGTLTARRFFLPLGDDLPPGPYRIRFSFSDPEDTYLSLSRTSTGAAETRTLRRESLFSEDST